jgi:uncharacterized protein YacL
MDGAGMTQDPTTLTARARVRRSGGFGLVELIRLVVVILGTAAGYEAARGIAVLQELRSGTETWTLAVVLLGSCLGYVVGGVFGRFLLGRIDAAERTLRAYSPGEMLAAALGGFVGILLSLAVTWPFLLFQPKHLTVPLAVLVAIILVATGVKVGVARGGDLLRFLGASGRLSVTLPSQGGRARVVDTSALIDGRLVDVGRAGFLEGTLIVPRFILYELQGLADGADDERRSRGRRGLDVLAALQRSGGVAVEVSDRDYPEVDSVDAKLVAMAREQKNAIVTVDANLSRVAEVQGVKVLNLHVLAENLRPPVLPGDMIAVRVIKAGKEPGQGVGYLSDGTMVVVEGGHDRQGSEVSAEVTSILSNPNGRMVFATLRVPPRLVHGAAQAE